MAVAGSGVVGALVAGTVAGLWGVTGWAGFLYYIAMHAVVGPWGAHLRDSACGTCLRHDRAACCVARPCRLQPRQTVPAHHPWSKPCCVSLGSYFGCVPFA